MKKLLKTLSVVLPLATLMALGSSKVQAADGTNMYRLYNPNSGEHFYTANAGERDNLTHTGWSYEGIGWVAPKSGKPVYRLYNRYSGDHHYTVNAGERNALVNVGWKYEGVGWYSGGSVPLYRQYNAKAKSGTHNYTTSKAENDQLVRAGWRAEGVGWYGIGAGKTVAWSPRSAGDITELVKQFKNKRTANRFSLYSQTGVPTIIDSDTDYGTYLSWESRMPYSPTYNDVRSLERNINRTLNQQFVQLPDDQVQWKYDGVTIILDSHEWPAHIDIFTE